MRAQISFEMLLWIVISAVFLLTSATFSYHVLHNQIWSNQAALYERALSAANISISPYSEFGIAVDYNGT